MNKRIITVTGATGKQGGGLVRAILADPSGDFAVRAVTRKTEGDAARALRDLGVEVVFGDHDDGQSLARAFAGAYGAFCVTNYFEHGSAETDTAQGRSLAEATSRAGVEHAIWSTLEDSRAQVPLSDERMPTLQGSYKIPNFDGKASADHFFQEAGVPTTLLYTSFYWDNFINFGMGPIQAPDGSWVWTLPMADKKLPGIAAEDIGKCVLGIFKRPDLIGKKVGVASEHLTGAELAESWGRAVGRTVTYTPMSHDAYRALGFPGADEMGNLFQYHCELEREMCARRDVAFSRTLATELLSFDQWLARNRSRIAPG